MFVLLKNSSFFSIALYNISPVLLKFQNSSRFNLHLFIGASLSKKIIAKLVRRYSNKEGDISINDFISVASKVASCLGSYKLTLDKLNPYLEVKSILLAMKTRSGLTFCGVDHHVMSVGNSSPHSTLILSIKSTEKK